MAKKNVVEPIRTKVYKTTDLLKYKFGEIEVEFSPLSHFQKNEINPLINRAIKVRNIKDASGRESQVQEQDLQLMAEAMQLAIKYSVKSVKWLYDSEDNEYVLTFDSNNLLTDDCVSDLMNIQEQAQISYIAGSFLGGSPRTTNLPEGISFLGVRTKK